MLAKQTQIWVKCCSFECDWIVTGVSRPLNCEPAGLVGLHFESFVLQSGTLLCCVVWVTLGCHVGLRIQLFLAFMCSTTSFLLLVLASALIVPAERLEWKRFWSLVCACVCACATLLEGIAPSISWFCWRKCCLSCDSAGIKTLMVTLEQHFV